MTLMTDKELLSPKDYERMLLELAAKAAGLNIKAERVDVSDQFTHFIVGAKNTRERVDWNPLTDDGDALRLAVKLRLDIHVDSNLTEVLYLDSTTEAHIGDPYAATRRAIVRAAAQIGEKL